MSWKGMRIIPNHSPCEGCCERKPGCHGNCRRYEGYKRRCHEAWQKCMNRKKNEGGRMDERHHP